MMKKAHFIGIAGKGMSAVALLLKQHGWEISGSDTGFYPPVSTYLEENNIPFAKEYKKENIPEDADLVVIGKNAKLIPEENEEVKAAFKSGKSVRSFPEVIAGLVAETHNIVVAGSFGKSTSTALLAWCLKSAGKDPSYFIGEIVRGFDAHAHSGEGNLFVLEGDEYPSANWDSTSKFLYYNPHDVLLTSAEHDHINVFKTHEAYLEPFKQLLSLIPKDGLLVASADDESARALAHTHTGKKVLYGITNKEALWSATDIVLSEKTHFTLTKSGEPVMAVETSLLGKHNVENIVGVSALLLEKQLVTPEELVKGIKTFEGVTRRLILLSPNSSVRVYEGYGSSYSKARAAIKAVKDHFPHQRLVMVFEPHTFSWRNRDTLSWYDTVFEGGQKILIYEPATQGATTHNQLSQEEIIKRVCGAGFDAVPIHSKEDGVRMLNTTLEPQDILLLLTSGDLGGLIEVIPELVTKKFPRS
ncbi:MAG TPA: Mur ligase family protein [Candidatus Paceibacterota bacterium]